jgi:hypothetical protein
MNNNFLYDVDGNRYKSTIIGDQEWLIEPYRVTHYSDGSPIPNGITDDQWINGVTETGA